MKWPTTRSSAKCRYFLVGSTNLASPFTLLASNIIGQATTTTFTDTNAAGLTPLFHHIGVGN